jgi:transposase
MKTITENPAPVNSNLPATVPSSPPRPLLKLGLDVHLHSIVAVIQEGQQTPKSPRKFTRPELVEYVRKQVQAGMEVWCVQEACGFGFVLHRQLEALGAHSLVITPIPLHEPGSRRKTDKLDAGALCLRLSRYLQGDHRELRPIRIPTEEEQRRREIHRRREFIQREIRRLDNRGRALVLEHCHETLPSGWWGPRKWKWHCQELDPHLRAILETFRDLALKFHEQLRSLTEELERRMEGQAIPRGLGALTMAILDAEVCDWRRFTNRKRIGSYTGCCPGVYGSGNLQRFGSIDRHGNGRLRRQLVEAVWRLLRYQPRWHASRKHLKRLGDSVAQKKKVVVALARQLAIDLWRWRTGRCTLADLGLETLTVGPIGPSSAH